MFFRLTLSKLTNSSRLLAADSSQLSDKLIVVRLWKIHPYARVWGFQRVEVGEIVGKIQAFQVLVA